MSSKKESQIKHAIKRAKQRFELSLTKTDLIDIVRNIQNNIDCVFIKKQSNRVSIFIIKYKDQQYRVVYDKERKSIVTFLHLNKSIEEYRDEISDKNRLENIKFAKFEKELKEELSEVWDVGS